MNDLEDWYYIRFGEIFELTRVCYFKGKELGFEDNHIFLEWPDNVIFYNKIKYEFPGYSVLPIGFVEKGSYKDSDYDKIVNLNDVGSLYENSAKFCNNGKRNSIQLFNYSNKYFLETGVRPVFNIEKQKKKRDYILIHTRKLVDSNYRNTDTKLLFQIYKEVLEDYKVKYDIYSFGDIQFIEDSHIGYTGNINRFIRLINNSKLVIGNPSGPNCYAIGLGIPFIEIDTNNQNKPTNFGWYSEEFWKSIKDGIYGKSAFDFVDKDKLSIVYKDNPTEVKIQMVREFLKRHL